MRSVGLRGTVARRLVTARPVPRRAVGAVVRVEEHGDSRGRRHYHPWRAGRAGQPWLLAGHDAARGLHGSPPRLAEVIMNVPNMGDSITEGTLQAWQKQVGDSVKVDDVVAIIETDKVSVDIRAKDAGVLVEQYAKADETVGAKLLKIDTAAAPGSVAPAPAAAAPPSPSQPSVEAQPAAPSGPHHRTPLIKFLGKRSLLSQGGAKQQQHGGGGGPSTSVAVSKAGGAAPVRYEDIKGTPGAKSFADLPPLFGRPALSKQEIEAIESGGAL